MAAKPPRRATRSVIDTIGGGMAHEVFWSAEWRQGPVRKRITIRAVGLALILMGDWRALQTQHQSERKPHPATPPPEQNNNKQTAGYNPAEQQQCALLTLGLTGDPLCLDPFFGILHFLLPYSL